MTARWRCLSDEDSDLKSIWTTLLLRLRPLSESKGKVRECPEGGSVKSFLVPRTSSGAAILVLCGLCAFAGTVCEAKKRNLPRRRKARKVLMLRLRGDG